MLRARAAAYAKASAYSPQELTAKARERFLGSFLEKIDALYPGLPETERFRRATALRKAHFTKLAYLSAKARRR